MGPGAKIHTVWIPFGLTPSKEKHSGKEMCKSESKKFPYHAGAYTKLVGHVYIQYMYSILVVLC